MTMDEVLRMDVDRALIIIRGKNVLEIDKYDYSKHPESKKMRSSKAAAMYRRGEARRQANPRPPSILPRPPPLLPPLPLIQRAKSRPPEKPGRSLPQVKIPLW